MYIYICLSLITTPGYPKFLTFSVRRCSPAYSRHQIFLLFWRIDDKFRARVGQALSAWDVILRARYGSYHHSNCYSSKLEGALRENVEKRYQVSY